MRPRAALPRTHPAGYLVFPLECVQLRASRVRGVGHVEVRVRVLEVPWLRDYPGGEIPRFQMLLI